jgi:hypothetical protein
MLLLLNIRRQQMKRFMKRWAALALIAAVAIISGCGGDDDTNDARGGSGGGSRDTNNLAPATIGGRTLDAAIDGTTIVWQMIFTGDGPNTGTYEYSEDGRHIASGSYTYERTAPDVSSIVIRTSAGPPHDHPYFHG